MNDTTFRVEGIDHVELMVPDRYEAAQWYEQTLGLSVCRKYEFWVDDGGPLMIAAADDTSKLALFAGDTETGPKPLRVAFHVNGTGFLRFLERLSNLELTRVNGEAATRSDVIDHDVAFSIYFQDPYGTPLEVTTYDYEQIEPELNPS